MWIALIAQVLGSVAAHQASKMGKEETMRLIRSVSDAYGNIDVPKLKELFLEKMPETALEGIRDDPEYRSQQNAADAQLEDVVQSGGLTLADMAALNRIRQGSARNESAGRRAIEQSMASRGSLDSGAQLAMQLQEQQQAANSAAMADESAAAQAQARVFQAIRERAANASQGLDRDYQRQSDLARATDAINAGNVAIANTAARYNAGLPQQNFENQLKKTGAQANATYATAGQQAANTKDDQQAMQGAFNVAGQAAQTGYDEYRANQARSEQLGAWDGGSLGASAGVGAGSNLGVGAGFGVSSGADALTGSPTRRARRVVGQRFDGSPIHEDELR